METANILVDLRPPLAVVTLNRPQVLNALNTATLMELDGVLNHLRANAGVRVVLLTGAGGKAFAAGADIRELAPLNAAEAQAAAERGQSVFRKIEDLGKPVIACINGFALGGGCELALA
jgi:enoyl-CoA hydratase